MQRFFLLAVLTMPPLFAQSFPAKPLRLVVPYPAGRATDLMARLVAQKLSDSFRQQVIVDNKPGAGGNSCCVARPATTNCAPVAASASRPTSSGATCCASTSCRAIYPASESLDARSNFSRTKMFQKH